MSLLQLHNTIKVVIFIFNLANANMLPVAYRMANFLALSRSTGTYNADNENIRQLIDKQTIKPIILCVLLCKIKQQDEHNETRVQRLNLTRDGRSKYVFWEEFSKFSVCSPDSLFRSFLNTLGMCTCPLLDLFFWALLRYSSSSNFKLAIVK
jgi:hypothetical protein